MGPNRSFRSGYLYTLFTLNYLGSFLLLLYMVLGLTFHYDYVPIIYCCSIFVHDKTTILIGTWSLT
jgi:hypothetical protein